MKKLFKRLMHWLRPAPPLPMIDGRIHVDPDPKGAPGTRIYHEYFVPDEPDTIGKWPWRGRVYSAGGQVHEKVDRADTRDVAVRAAVAWCTRTKEQLRGEA